jgi:hypothetical protein
MVMCWCCGHDEVCDNEEFGGIDSVALAGTILPKTQTLNRMPSMHNDDNSAIKNVKKTGLILLFTVFSFNKIK